MWNLQRLKSEKVALGMCKNFFEKISIKRPLFFSMSLINSSSIPHRRAWLTLNHSRAFGLVSTDFHSSTSSSSGSFPTCSLSPQITAWSANITAHRDACWTRSARLSITIANKTGLLIPGISSIPFSYCYHGPIYRLPLPERKHKLKFCYLSRAEGGFFKGKLPTVSIEI